MRLGAQVELRPSVLRVLGALLGDSLEQAILRRSIRPPIAFRSVNNRSDVLASLRDDEPDVVVFAVHDGNGLPTAPLISECTRARPASRIVLLCAAPPPRGGAILAAARAGARVLIAPTSTELALVFERISRSLKSELALDCEALASVQPPMLRQLLCAAAITVAGDGRVDSLAQHLRVSTRTVSRYTRRTGSVQPKELLSTARLLWACALMNAGSHNASAVARATGFAGAQAMDVAIKRYLGVLAGRDSVAALPNFRDALREIVDMLGGNLET